jgi:hypothetical protein
MAAMKEFNGFGGDSVAEYCEVLEKGIGLIFRDSVRQFEEIGSWLNNSEFGGSFGVAHGTDMRLRNAVLVLPRSKECVNKEFSKQKPKLDQMKSIYQPHGKMKRSGGITQE